MRTGKRLAHEHPGKSVLGGAMGFQKTELFIDGDVLRHPLVGVQPHRIATEAQRMLFTEGHQHFAEALALVPGRHRDVDQQQLVAFLAHHQHTEDFIVVG